MSAAHAWTRGASAAHVHPRAAGPTRAARVTAGAGGGRPTPLVAILCTAPRARATAAAIALAVAQRLERPCAVAAVAGEQPSGALAGMPFAHRLAVALRERSFPASASGRVVWLADRRGPLAADDPAGRAAALSAELGRAAVAAGLPAAVAIPFARTAALDRVLAWHDALVVVRESDAANGVVERALTSLAELGRPVVAMAPPRRSSELLALAGLAVPSEAEAAVAALALEVPRGDV